MKAENIILLRLRASYNHLRNMGKVHTQKDFAESIGWQPSHLSSAFNGNSSRLTKGLMESIWETYPFFNLQWLLGNDENMLTNQEPEGEILKSQHGRAELPVGEYREDEILEKFMTCLVPMSAMGGSLVGFEESGVRREDCEKVVSPIADADWAVPVCGDSMEPEYPNGSRVFVKQINPGDFIQWGNVFVLDTTNGLIIKMVMQSDKKDCIKCVSLNPSGRYQPFDVPMRTVRAMYRVLLCVSIK